jgi:hypothetical protein
LGDPKIISNKYLIKFFSNSHEAQNWWCITCNHSLQTAMADVRNLAPQLHKHGKQKSKYCREQKISMWYSFVSITDEAASFYHTSLSMIELLATVFMVIEIPMLLVALWVFGRYGLRTGITITAICGCLGSWVR